MEHISKYLKQANELSDSHKEKVSKKIKPQSIYVCNSPDKEIIYLELVLKKSGKTCDIKLSRNEAKQLIIDLMNELVKDNYYKTRTCDV